MHLLYRPVYSDSGEGQTGDAQIMALSQKQEAQILKIANALQEFVAEAKKMPARGKQAASDGARTRRTGKDLVEFKKNLKKERKAGVPVSELAEKYGVTASYIYQMRD